MAGRFIGLITDFGESPYTGILREVIKSINPNADIIDIDHSIPNYNVTSGAYIVFNTYHWMPKDSVILVVVDPGVGGAREALAVKAGDYLFIGPNNGVLYPAIVREGYKYALSLDPEKIVEKASRFFRGKLVSGGWSISSTFHGRDVFAPAAALATLDVDLSELGSPLSFDDLKKSIIEQVERTEEGYRVKVIYIDKFGNIALSARPGLIPVRSWKEAIVRTDKGTFRATIGRKFSDASPGELILYINSFGFLELAINLGSAHRKLSVDIGDRIVLTPIA